MTPTPQLQATVPHSVPADRLTTAAKVHLSPGSVPIVIADMRTTISQFLEALSTTHPALRNLILEADQKRTLSREMACETIGTVLLHANGSEELYSIAKESIALCEVIARHQDHKHDGDDSCASLISQIGRSDPLP